MSTILETICETKKEEVALLRRNGICGERIDAPRNFYAALKDKTPVGLIAEIKKASPSRGVIRPDFNPEKIAGDYEKGGANCISVLTDENYFQGKNEYVKIVRTACLLPVIRKDFIIDSLQIEEAYKIGADAILLIVAILDEYQLADFYVHARGLDLNILVEVHNAQEMEKALKIKPEIIGVNNRNLHDFSVSLDTTKKLAEMVSPETILVSESGIFTNFDVEKVKEFGAKAILVGESLMRQENLSSAVKNLLGF